MCVSSVLVSNSLPRCFPKVAKKSCNQQWCRQGGHTVHGHIWEITSIAGAGRLVAAEVWAGQKLNQNSKPATTRICNLCCSSQKIRISKWVVSHSLSAKSQQVRSQDPQGPLDFQSFTFTNHSLRLINKIHLQPQDKTRTRTQVMSRQLEKFWSIRRSKHQNSDRLRCATVVSLEQLKSKREERQNQNA